MEYYIISFSSFLNFSESLKQPKNFFVVGVNVDVVVVFIVAIVVANVDTVVVDIVAAAVVVVVFA